MPTLRRAAQPSPPTNLPPTQHRPWASTMAAPPPPPASPLSTLTPIVPRNPRIPRRGPSQHKGEPENHAQALEASPSRALTRANQTHGTPRPHHPPAPSAGCCASGSGRGVSAPNGSGRPEPAHRAPGAELDAAAPPSKPPTYEGARSGGPSPALRSGPEPLPPRALPASSRQPTLPARPKRSSPPTGALLRTHSAGSGSGRGVSAPNGSGRPEPAHRAPGAEPNSASFVHENALSVWQSANTATWLGFTF